MLARTQTSHCIHNNLSQNVISLIEITEFAMQSIGFAIHNTLFTSVICVHLMLYLSHYLGVINENRTAK